MTAQERESLHKMARMCAEQLYEHCDAVVIMCSVTSEDEGERITDMISNALGNHHTRIGLAFDYLLGLAMQKSKLPEDEEND
jgi:hypothetical protein